MKLLVNYLLLALLLGCVPEKNERVFLFETTSGNRLVKFEAPRELLLKQQNWYLTNSTPSLCMAKFVERICSARQKYKYKYQLEDIESIEFRKIPVFMGVGNGKWYIDAVYISQNEIKRHSVMMLDGTILDPEFVNAAR